MMLAVPWRKPKIDRLYAALVEADGRWCRKSDLMRRSSINTESEFHLTIWRLRHRKHVEVVTGYPRGRSRQEESSYRLRQRTLRPTT